MEGISADNFSFKRKDQAITLACKSSVKVDGELVQVDPQLLFQRLTLAGKSNLEDTMIHELCTFPPALFETRGLLNEPQKASFADAIWSFVKNKEVLVPKQARTILDGGALVHRLPWKTGSTFASILESYSDYVIKKYGKAVIVFDGYCGASTKDMTHRQRTRGKKGPTVSFTKEMCLTVSKELFLIAPQNKQCLIELLGEVLQEAGCEVFHAQADADVLIVQKAIESANSKDTVLVGDDTDLLVLLLYHLTSTSYNLFLAPEPKKNAKQRVWNIKQAREDLGLFSCKHILFQHALMGCDTTSRLFGIGKGSILKKFKVNSSLQQAATVFDSVASTHEDIAFAGEKALVAMYNGKKDETLNALRLN